MSNTTQSKTSTIFHSLKRKFFYLVLAHGYYVLTKIVNRLESKLRERRS